jgi:hypothetical protein
MLREQHIFIFSSTLRGGYQLGAAFSNAWLANKISVSHQSPLSKTPPLQIDILEK